MVVSLKRGLRVRPNKRTGVTYFKPICMGVGRDKKSNSTQLKQEAQLLIILLQTGRQIGLRKSC